MATYPTAVTNEVDPISRIEGHLGVAVHVTAGKIDNAYAHGNLWRGFENFLLNRAANDAITFVQRICGVCPVPHGMTSTYAVDTVLGYSAGHITFADEGPSGNGVPTAAVLIRNLVLGMEFLMSSITHFYHLAAPSYIQGPAIPPWTPYFDDSYYHPALLNNGPNHTLFPNSVAITAGARAYPTITPNLTKGAGFSADVWSTVIRSYVVALKIRRMTFEAGALFAGRMPMTSVFVGGGVTYDKGEIGTAAFIARCNQYKTIAQGVGQFVIQEYVPIALALGVLYPNYDNLNNAATLQSAYSTWWGYAGNASAVAPTTANTAYGAGLGRFLAWGGFPSTSTAASAALALAGGVKFTAAEEGSTAKLTSFTVANKSQVASKFISAAATNTCVPANLTEDISNSRYAVASADTAAYAAHGGVAAYPGAVSRTKPARASGYTYMKAPRWAGLPCEVGPMARMFVSGLFVNGQGLANASGAIFPFYAQYVKACTGGTVNGVYGLDPKMVNADVAVALVQAGLATLSSSASGTPIVSGPADLPTSAATTVTVYTDSDTVITGAIADWVVLLKAGFSTMDRLRGRALESLYLIQQILGTYSKTGTWSGGAFTGSWGGGWIDELIALPTGSSTWKNKTIPAGTFQGWGGTEAPRGALMHQCTITDGLITKYQCIVPTTWNGSPTDGTNHGAIEQAVIGAPFSAAGATFVSQGGGSVHTAGGVEVLRIAQSFDPCIACAVH